MQSHAAAADCAASGVVHACPLDSLHSPAYPKQHMAALFRHERSKVKLVNPVPFRQLKAKSCIHLPSPTPPRALFQLAKTTASIR